MATDKTRIKNYATNVTSEGELQHIAKKSKEEAKEKDKNKKKMENAKKAPEKKAKKKKKKNYINNPDMLRELIKSKEQDKMTDTFARMIMLLIKRYSSQGSYSDYTYKEDMESYAMYIVCRVWNRFDETKYDNPFAYFTQTIKRAFWQFLAQEEKHRDIRDVMLVKEGELPSHTFDEKHYQEMITDAYKESVEKGRMNTRFKNLLKKHIEMLVGDPEARENIFEDIREEFLRYEIEKKTNMFEFFNRRISEKSKLYDPSYREIDGEDYEEEYDDDN